jgi:hypothetical protein
MIVTLLIYEVLLRPLCCLRRLDDCGWQNVLTVNSDKWKWSWPVSCRPVTNVCMKGKTKDWYRDSRRFRHGICHFWNRKQGCQWLAQQFYGWRFFTLSGVQFFLPMSVSRVCRSFTVVVVFTWHLLLMHVFPRNVWLVVVWVWQAYIAARYMTVCNHRCWSKFPCHIWHRCWWFDIPVSLYRWLGVCSGDNWVHHLLRFFCFKYAASDWVYIASGYSI